MLDVRNQTRIWYYQNGFESEELHIPKFTKSRRLTHDYFFFFNGLVGSMWLATLPYDNTNVQNYQRPIILVCKLLAFLFDMLIIFLAGDFGMS